MESESRELPGAAVASTARSMAGRWAWIALAPGLVALLFALTEIAHHQKHGFPHGVGAAIFVGVTLVGFPLGLAVWFLLRARRYSKLAKLSETDAGLRWHLSGSLVVASRDGVPRPEHTFSIARYLRRSLTTVPRAIQVK